MAVARWTKEAGCKGPLLLAAVLLLLLAGCLGTPHDEEEAFRPPAHWSRALPDERFPDLALAGNHTRAGRTVHYQAEAGNSGASVWTWGLCYTPWEEHMAGSDGREVAFRKPRVHCQSFSLDELPDGGRAASAQQWNGTLWVDEAQRYEPAPAGAYTWHVSFHADPDDDPGSGGPRIELDLAFAFTLPER